MRLPLVLALLLVCVPSCCSADLVLGVSGGFAPPLLHEGVFRIESESGFGIQASAFLRAANRSAFPWERRIAKSQGCSCLLHHAAT